jgi:phosphoglucosamine mutase
LTQPPPWRWQRKCGLTTELTWVEAAAALAVAAECGLTNYLTQVDAAGDLGKIPSMPRLFGTDGVRGIANSELTPDLALALGRAAGIVLAPQGGEVVVGRDTRVSGPMLEGALVAGLCSAGATVRLAGVLPTPGIAWLTLDERAAAGAVISASHNPVADNGIKFFSDEGLKIPGAVEDKIESLMESPFESLPVGAEIGPAEPLPDATERYVGHLVEAITGNLNGLRIVLDCAHGAAWEVAPLAFERAGADIIALHTEPDGTRINVDCGSTSTREVARRVVDDGADLGLAFDGDADRVIAIDERGRDVDGDKIIAMSALALKRAGALDKDLVVATVMANLSFHKALENEGITVVTAPVGDRFVAEAMAEHAAVLGGEQSGHVIFASHSTTGDGILTGLKIAEAVTESGRSLSELSDVFEPYPQVLLNIEVESRDALEGAEDLWAEVRAAEAALGDEGRVLVRASGTEPVIRVMVEASDAETARSTAESLAETVRRTLG